MSISICYRICICMLYFAPLFLCNVNSDLLVSLTTDILSPYFCVASYIGTMIGHVLDMTQTFPAPRNMSANLINKNNLGH